MTIDSLHFTLPSSWPDAPSLQGFWPPRLSLGCGDLSFAILAAEPLGVIVGSMAALVALGRCFSKAGFYSIAWRSEVRWYIPRL